MFNPNQQRHQEKALSFAKTLSCRNERKGVLPCFICLLKKMEILKLEANDLQCSIHESLRYRLQNWLNTFCRKYVECVPCSCSKESQLFCNLLQKNTWAFKSSYFCNFSTKNDFIYWKSSEMQKNNLLLLSKSLLAFYWLQGSIQVFVAISFENLDSEVFLKRFCIEP